MYYSTKKMQRMQSNIEPMKNLINVLVTFLMDCDKANDLEFFETFCELNFMEDFIKLNNLSIYEISYSIIQSLSFLLVNISNTQYLFYFFSNDSINQIISIDITKYDDEYLSYYINFLKSLSMRINSETIQFFFDESTNRFPIVEQAIKLYNYSNSMISTVVHSIILALLNIGYTPIKDYFGKLPTISYFIYIVCHLRDLYQKFIEDKNDYEAYEDIIDEIMYISDILCIGIEKINYILTNAMFYYFIMPKIMIEIFNEIHSENTMIVLIALFRNIKDEHFLNLLYTICFAKKISSDLFSFCTNNDPPIRGYRFKWNEQIKVKSSFIEFICDNYSDNFFSGLRYQTCFIYEQNDYKELKKVKKEALTLSKIHKFENKVDYKDIEKKVVTFFTLEQYKEMGNYHFKLSIALGVKVGVCFDNDKKVDASFISKMHDYMNNKYDNKLKIIENPIRMKLMKMIENMNFPNEENYLILSHFLIWMIHHQSNVSEVLIAHSKLNCYTLTNYKNKNSELIDEILFELLPFDLTMSDNEEEVIKGEFYFDNNFMFSMKNIFFNFDTNTNNNYLIKRLLNLFISGVKSIELTELLCINLNNFCFTNKDTKTLTIIQYGYEILFMQIQKLSKEQKVSKEKMNEICRAVILRYARNAYNKNYYELYQKRIYSILKIKSNLKPEEKIESSLLCLFYLKNIIVRLSGRQSLLEDIYIVGQSYDFKLIKEKEYDYSIKKDSVILIDNIFIYKGSYKFKENDDKVDEYVHFDTMNYLNKTDIKVITEKKSIIVIIDKQKSLYDLTEENQKEIERIQNIVKEKKNKTTVQASELFSIEKTFNFIINN